MSAALSEEFAQIEAGLLGEDPPMDEGAARERVDAPEDQLAANQSVGAVAASEAGGGTEAVATPGSFLAPPTLGEHSVLGQEAPPAPAAAAKAAEPAVEMTPTRSREVSGPLSSAKGLHALARTAPASSYASPSASAPSAAPPSAAPVVSSADLLDALAKDSAGEPPAKRARASRGPKAKATPKHDAKTGYQQLFGMKRS